MQKLDHNNHSVFKLTYHLVMVVKYRKRVITPEICNRLKEIMISIGESFHVTVDEFSHDGDHVHVLLTAYPNTTLSKFINAFKTVSSRFIKREFPMIRKSLWKDAFWSQSYCLLTTGGAPLDVIRNYVTSQGEGMKRKYVKKAVNTHAEHSI